LVVVVVVGEWGNGREKGGRLFDSSVKIPDLDDE
jgi:hypothetical protein